MYVDQLAVEVTRRCNAECAHCLRGDPQNIDIRPEYIETLASNISEVCLFTISGGEPSLALPQIKYLLNCFKEKNLEIRDQLYVATNALENTAELIELLKPWTKRTKVILAASNTAMHPEVKPKTLRRIEKCGFGRIGSRESMVNHRVILEGRAQKNYKDVLYPRSAYYPDQEITVEHSRIYGMMYVNALGFVIEGSTYSYETQDSGAATKGHIFDFFEDIKKWKKD